MPDKSKTWKSFDHARTIIRPLNLNWNAGDIFEIDSKKYVVLTAAHHIDTGAIGGSMGTSSKFWIANL